MNDERFGATAVLTTVVTVAAIAAAVVTGLRSWPEPQAVRKQPPAAAPSPPSPLPGANGPITAVACIANRPLECERKIADLRRRTPLTAEQSAGLAPDAARATAAINDARSRSVPDISDALAAAGFEEAVVREARADDPVSGGVITAIPMPNGCLVGETMLYPVGHLPDGTCLPA